MTISIDEYNEICKNYPLIDSRTNFQDLEDHDVTFSLEDGIDSNSPDFKHIKSAIKMVLYYTFRECYLNDAFNQLSDEDQVIVKLRQ
jgi:hypothetical protein